MDRRHSKREPVPATSFSLTLREEQVARAIAAGLTSREAAERLAIGVRTVETHLANAYAKLGICSRADLASALSDIDARGNP